MRRRAGHRAALPGASRLGLSCIALGVVLVVIAVATDGDLRDRLALVVFAVSYAWLVLGSLLVARTASRAASRVAVPGPTGRRVRLSDDR